MKQPINPGRTASLPLAPLADEFNHEQARLIANIRNLAAVADITNHSDTPDVFNILLDLNYRIERAIARLTAAPALPGIQPRITKRKRAKNQPK
jgi:hypothetical protein